MAYHHKTIRKHVVALLDFFNDLEVEYTKSDSSISIKKIPIVYSSREKNKIFDKVTLEQFNSGNYNFLPRASLSLNDLTKAEQRITNKNNKINLYKTEQEFQYSLNSVPYEFTYELFIQCRGMNETTQIIEQIGAKFHSNVHIDVWEANNLNEATRIPIKLINIGLEDEEYNELSSNLFNLSCTFSITGNLYQPIKTIPRIQEFIIKMNEIDEQYYTTKETLNWDVDENGNIIA